MRASSGSRTDAPSRRYPRGSRSTHSAKQARDRLIPRGESSNPLVIPAKPGTQRWVPAFAGMTGLSRYLLVERGFRGFAAMRDCPLWAYPNRTIRVALRRRQHLPQLHVVDKDLIAALDSGQLSYAALDVLWPEPLPRASSLWLHLKVTVMPYVARRPTVAQLVAEIAANIRSVEAGGRLLQEADITLGH
jgi:D-isomer specific 2-hydroxyacid dehydrogenase, NAD binding domain